MRSVVALLLLTSSVAYAGTKPSVIYNCNWASGNDVIDMACNIYFEARNEPLMGQFMVGHTVLNRMASKHYPSTVSGVVYEKRRSAKTGKMVPMYSWTLDGKADLIRNPQAWQRAITIAVKLIHSANDVPDMTFGAMWYHADYVKPNWAKSYHQTTYVGRHIFYTDNMRTAMAVMAHIARRSAAYQPDPIQDAI